MINYAVQYQSKIAERFHLASITDSACGHDYKFNNDGRTIKIGSVNTVSETSYKRTGTNRFGDVQDVGDTLQEMTCTQTPAFSFTIDALDGTDQAIQKSAATSLRRQLDEVTVPNMDKYRLRKWAENANIQITPSETISKNTIAGLVIDADAAMTDALVPLDGRTLFIGTQYYKLLKQNPDYLGVDTLGKEALTRGAVGEFDGCIVKPVPTSYLPKGVYFMIKYSGSTVDPVKLQQYDILPKVQGYSGPVVQGVSYYDAFVLGTKGDGIAVCGDASVILAAPKMAIASHAVTITAVSGVVFKYTTDGTNPRYSDTAKIYTAPVTLTADQTMRAIGTADGCCGMEGVQAYA